MIIRLSRRSAFSALAASTLIAAVSWSAPASASSAGLPSDPAASGYVGFCNEAGQNVSGGSLDAKPFVWKAVSSTRPPAAFQGRGENAVLNIYQPRPQVQPAEWSGLSLTSATFYTTPKSPAVQSTYGDGSLRDFVHRFPPKINGLYQVRVYYGRANYGLYHAKYPVTTIQVTGSTWRVVSGGTVNCAHAAGISNEQLTGAVSKTESTPHKPSTTQRISSVKPGRTIDAKPVSATGAPAADSPSGDRSDRAGHTSQSAARSSSSQSSPTWVLWSLLGLVVLLAAGLAAALKARRSSPRA